MSHLLTRLSLIALIAVVVVFPGSAQTPVTPCDPTQDYITRGRLALAAPNIELVLGEYTCALSIDPESAAAYYGRAEAYAQGGNYASAVLDYEQAIPRDPESALPYFGRGKARAALTDFFGAIEDFDQVERLNPTLPGLYFERGSARLANGDPSGAVDDLSRVIDADPLATDAYIQRGLAYGELDNDDAAITDFTAAIIQNPDEALIYIYRAVRYVDVGDLESAVADYTDAIALDRYNAVNYYQRGLHTSTLGDLEQGIADYTASLTLDPRFIEAWYARGLNFAALGDHVRAVDDYTRTIALAPSFAEAYIARIDSLKVLERYDEAIADYTSLITLLPENVEFYWGRGELLYYIRFDYPGTIADMTEVINRDPAYADGEPYLLRGTSFARIGDYASAIPDLRGYLTVVTEDRAARLLLTVALAVTGDLAGATESVYTYADSAGIDLENATPTRSGEPVTLATAGVPLDGVYSFTIEGEARVTISAELNEGTPDPLLVLIDPNGDVIAANDDLDPTTRTLTAVLFDVPLTVPGTYTVLVTTYPDTLGTFTLTVTVS